MISVTFVLYIYTVCAVNAFLALKCYINSNCLNKDFVHLLAFLGTECL